MVRAHAPFRRAAVPAPPRRLRADPASHASVPPGPSDRLGMRPRSAALAPCASMFALGLIPDLTDDAPVIVEAALDDDVDQQIQKPFDVGAVQRAAARTLLDEQHELLECKL